MRIASASVPSALKLPTFLWTIALQRFVNRDWLSPPRKNIGIIAQNRRGRTRRLR